MSDLSKSARLPGWSNLSEHMPVRFLMYTLPGRLSHNRSLFNLLNPYVQAPDLYHRFMEDAFASLNDPASAWNKSEWVCGDCAVQFIKQEFYSWFVRRLVQGRSLILFFRLGTVPLTYYEDGYQFKPNCWWVSTSKRRI